MPSSQFVDQLVKRVRETGSLLNETTRLRSRPVRLAENIAVVAQSVLEHPSTSTRHRSLGTEHSSHFSEENFASRPRYEKKIIFSDEAHFHIGGYVNK